MIDKNYRYRRETVSESVSFRCPNSRDVRREGLRKKKKKIVLDHRNAPRRQRRGEAVQARNGRSEYRTAAAAAGIAVDRARFFVGADRLFVFTVATTGKRPLLAVQPCTLDACIFIIG